MIGPVETIRSFVSTLWRSRRTQTRVAFENWQHRKVARWVRDALPRVPFYADAPARLSDCTITDKAMLMAKFDQFNTKGLTVDAAWDVQKSGGRLGDLTVGASTGTSGNRGLFVISEREKHRWLGAILAKTMADLIWKPQRVAIILPQDTGLYGSANRVRFIRLQTFSLMVPMAQWRADLEAFNPTVIVAPPKVLRQFADQNFALSPVRVFCAAETLDPVDEQIATEFFKQPLRQIYMATEGLFAVSCAHGSLHLAEESVAFEFETVGELVSPLVTSFRRDTQIMARYKMNDLLRLSKDRCPCGSPLQVVSEIVGRMDDVFVFDAGRVMITPDILRNAVLDVDRSITDFRVIQTDEDHVTVHLPKQVSPDSARRVGAAVQAVIDRFDAPAKVTVQRLDLSADMTRKLRRVQRLVPHEH